MRRAPRGFVVIVAIAVVLGTMAVGASASAPEKAKPAAWAKTVCVSLGTWLEKIDAAASSASATPPTTPAQGKKALVKLLGSALGATKKLTATLKKAGPPAVQGGGGVASTVIGQFNQAARTFTSVRKSLKSLPTDAPGFVTASRGAQDALESGLEHVQAAFNAATTLDVEPLVAAFNAQPACQQLTA
jgi:hypothetical protein